MNEKIVNVYELKSDLKQKSYIYSLRKQEDYLGFDYYILSKNEENMPFIIEADNPLNLLQNSNVNLVPITKDSQEYETFINELSLALNTTETKESILSRK